MWSAISNTAEYGDYVTGPEIINADTKARMKAALERIQSGEFARNWMQENSDGCPNFNQARSDAAAHQIEEVGKELRSRIKFANAGKLVDKALN